MRAAKCGFLMDFLVGADGLVVTHLQFANERFADDVLMQHKIACIRMIKKS